LTRNWDVVAAAVLGLLTVVVGAFAAHGIKDPQIVDGIKTVAEWGMRFTLVILVLGAVNRNRWKFNAGMMLGGIAMIFLTVAGFGLLHQTTGLRMMEKGWAWSETALRYGIMHGWAILGATGLWRGGMDLVPGTRAAFLVGILLFSGSLYAMSIGAPRWFGAITPIGGLAFIVGWAMLAWAGFRRS
jgi:uncharacterized membrane protein YgdD (TMEM256/DUF423 family)